MNVYASKQPSAYIFLHLLLHTGCLNDTHAITLLARHLSPFARLASTTSPAFTFSPQTYRTASRVSQQPLFVPFKLSNPLAMPPATRHLLPLRAFHARRPMTGRRIHSREPHRCRHVADRSFSNPAPHPIGQLFGRSKH